MTMKRVLRRLEFLLYENNFFIRYGTSHHGYMPLLTQTDSESQNEVKSRKLQQCAHIDYEVEIMKISFDFPKSTCFKGS